MSQIIVIDLYSVVPDLAKTGSRLSGTPAKSLAPWVKAAQDKGCTVFFCAGQAHDGYYRQLIEAFLQSIGIRACFVTHGVPDGFDWFVSTKAFMFDGEHFPVA